jgi:hypothetical protein
VALLLFLRILKPKVTSYEEIELWGNPN